jgi:hypothetical protein
MLRKFTEELKVIMPQMILEILSYNKEKVYGIAFVTTDDYYGMYVAFETLEHLKESKYPDDAWFVNEWGYSDAKLPTTFNKELYRNLVDIIDTDENIDFTKPSAEKWDFAIQLIQAIKEGIDSIPQGLFKQFGYTKDEIVFLATMSDGDYMDEMLLESAKLFNSHKASKEILALYQ